MTIVHGWAALALSALPFVLAAAPFGVRLKGPGIRKAAALHALAGALLSVLAWAAIRGALDAVFGPGPAWAFSMFGFAVDVGLPGGSFLGAGLLFGLAAFSSAAAATTLATGALKSRSPKASQA